MEIGDRVQTLNTFVPITGEIVDMYKNLVTIADDDAETVDQLLSFHADDLEVISWITKKSLSVMRAKLISTQAHRLSLDWWMKPTTNCSTHTQRWTNGCKVWPLRELRWGVPWRNGIPERRAALHTGLPTWDVLLLGFPAGGGVQLERRSATRWLYVWNLFWRSEWPVSYTHLTLPTMIRV